MYSIRQYQVDAFATRAFAGNPAAVCPLASWPEDSLMQAIAEENNLSETAFFVPSAKGFRLRWFTPVREVDLCGHATLAAAHVPFEILGYPNPTIVFETLSGELTVRRRGGLLEMDFPAQPPLACPAPEALVEGCKAVVKANAVGAWTIGTVGAFPQPLIISNAMHNIPEKGMASWDWGYMARYHPEQFYLKQ